MKSELLKKMYQNHGIATMNYGVLGDTLGKIYEDFVQEIFQNKNSLQLWCEKGDLEKKVAQEILHKINIELKDITHVISHKNIPRRNSGGNPKTDVFIKFNNQISVPISVKQTTQNKVAFAEFDVNTIINEVGITCPDVKRLMLKHQTDASAKNFTVSEKQLLTEKIKPFTKPLVRWIITSSTQIEPERIDIPSWILKFTREKNDSENPVKNFYFYTIEEYIDLITSSSAGFGTGLSWTYATGSKGKKIQFKG